MRARARARVCVCVCVCNNINPAYESLILMSSSQLPLFRPCVHLCHGSKGDTEAADCSSIHTDLYIYPKAAHKIGLAVPFHAG